MIGFRRAIQRAEEHLPFGESNAAASLPELASIYVFSATSGSTMPAAVTGQSCMDQHLKPRQTFVNEVISSPAA